MMGIYLLFFSLLRLIKAMISSTIPPHSHMIPTAVFSIARNHTNNVRIHVIDKIKIPLQLMIIPPEKPDFEVKTHIWFHAIITVRPLISHIK